MPFKIVTDSCCDLPDKEKEGIETVPMTITIDGRDYKDGIDLSRDEFYIELSTAKNPPGSASPSPGDFLAKFAEAEKVFVVTVSSSLSSSYNNALLAKDMYVKKFRDSLVYVFDSLNASVGQGLVLLKLKELLSENISTDKITEILENYIQELKTFFVLESMENLINSGRINRLLGRIISVLNIKFVMGKSSEGKIELFDKVRGSRRAFQRLIKIIGEYGNNFEDKILGIAHCNCPEKAEKFKEEIMKRYNFKDIIITKMGPTIATYADEGAILISF